MNRLMLLLSGALVSLSSQLCAVQLENFDGNGNPQFISPVTGKRFSVVAVPANQVTGETNAALADMGSDDDGCRHSSGVCEYEYYIATCPYSYFSALTVEWDEKSGRFLGDIGTDFKEWITGKDGFNSDWQVDYQHAYQIVNQSRKMQGQPPIDRKDFVMDQQSIPLERRYRYALQCYEKRGARPAVMAKVALTGAWAIRARLNIPVSHQSLAGGFEEVNDKVMRQITDGETFSLGKWTGIYQDIFTKAKLSDEAYLVAGMVYLGFEVRQGDTKACEDVLQKLAERFESKGESAQDGRELMRGLVRERKRMYSEYTKMLGVAFSNFASAISSEEFTRTRLPEVMLVVAESLRRVGNEKAAMDWYLALGQMEETQPKLRADIRSQKKAPGPDAPYLVQLGWIADRHVEELKAAGVATNGEISASSDQGLLNEILHGGLGTLDYVNKNWKPGSGGTQTDCAVMLDLIGKAVLDYHYRLEEWPKELGELWTKDVIRDRNRVNRFYDPVNGKPFQYVQPKGPNSDKAVLVCTEAAVPTAQGPRFGAYLHNNTVVWSDKPLKPGDFYGSK